MPLIPTGGPPLPVPPPGGGGPPGMPPGLGGPPGMGGPPPGMGGPPGLGMGMPPPPPFPSIDPAQVAPALGGIREMQVQDQQNLEAMQQATLSMLVEAMKAAPNPAAQAAQTAPGYPSPPDQEMA